MWEARAAAGRLADLVAHVRGWAGSEAQLFRSPAGDPAERLVVIDPRRRPVPDLPAELVARPPHCWDFVAVPGLSPAQRQPGSAQR